MALTLDSATLAAYTAASTADARAQAVIDALSGTVYVRVYNGAGTLMGEGTMAAPWATRSGSAITVGEVSSFTVLQSGTPNAASWYLRFETAGGRWVRGPFGAGGNFTWSLGSTWNAGQSGSLGTVTLNAKGTIQLVGAAIASAVGSAGLTVSGGGSTFTITGSGFGTRALLTPLFYRFFAPGEITNGVTASSYGYTVGGTVTASTSDGYVSGSGCLLHESTLGAFDSFPHLYYVPPSDRATIFQTYVYKLTRIAGTTDSGFFQMKGPRVSYDSEYTGVPRSTISFYHPSDCLAISHTNLGFFNVANAGSGGSGADDFGTSPAYASRFRANDWNLVEDFTDFGSVGASDGYQRVYHNGSQVGPYSGVSESIPFRSLGAHAIQYVSLFPGIDGFSTSNQYRVQFAEHVVDDTQARVVIGNASTWGACTQKHYMIPTEWSDTSVTASWRPLAFATSGQTVYGYVVNASGTVSAATSLVVP